MPGGSGPRGRQFSAITITLSAAARRGSIAGVPSSPASEVVSRWYASAGRDLPWRRTGTTPYAVLVSEVMLQQTPVARVVPVYTEWLFRWPTAPDLASATPGEAVRAWGRLGYPRRALRLHAAAQAIVTRHGGALPDNLAELLALPGVGDYTARAVAAFAFRQRHPVVDTNVRRVVARVIQGRADVPVSRRDLSVVAELLPEDAEAAAIASAAWMELGALICTARTPKCGICPLAPRCAWLGAGQPPLEHPVRRPQPYAGTDRHARGNLLALLRAESGPVSREQTATAWPDGVQRRRALASLTKDGLVERLPDGRYALPGPPSGAQL